MTATLDDGRQLRFATTDATGDPARPLGEDAVIAKAKGLLDAAGCRADAAEALIDAALALSDTDDLNTFLERLP